MPTFEITITKQLTENALFKWNNVYHVLAASITEAADYVDPLITFETAIHSERAELVNARLRQMGVGEFGTNYPLSQVGAFDSTGDALPIFLAVRMDLVPSFGRAGRKFYHVMLGEAEQANGLLTNGYEVLFAAAADAMIGTLGGILCADDGAPQYNTYVLKSEITQHQFKRKWARRGGV
jgi:hypothetical protein